MLSKKELLFVIAITVAIIAAFLFLYNREKTDLNPSQPGQKDSPPQKPLTHFQDSNFGVNFSHTDALSTFYDPHGGATSVAVYCRGKLIGGLKIGHAPPGGADRNFIESGKEYYRTKWKALSVDYSVYKTPLNYKFHYIKAKTPNSLVLERFVYLRDDPPKSSNDALDAMSRAFNFEFVYSEKDYETLSREVRVILDTFKIVNKH